MELDADDSQFYGSPEERQQLERRVNEFNASAWLDKHGEWGFGCPSRQPVPSSLASAKLHNPYAGVPYARQLTETLDDFFARLPPASTDQSDELPWIFICNPFVARQDKGYRNSDIPKGNEDEAPGEEGRQLRLVVQGSIERLELLADLTNKVTTCGKSQAFIGRELFRERRQAAADMLGLAHAGRVRTGKWMLFCPPTDVNEIWEIVAKATANNELGIAAKVAPRSASADTMKERLICVYTADFGDKADVGRVLQRLRELKLVGMTHRPIFYKPGESIPLEQWNISTNSVVLVAIGTQLTGAKPDIYTYVGISRGNPWGLVVSIYNSGEFPRDTAR